MNEASRIIFSANENCVFDCSVCDYYKDCEVHRYDRSCPRDIESDFPCENCNYFEFCEKAFRL